MTSTQAAIKIKNGLNKLDSKDYQNVDLHKIEEATNTARLRFVRRRIDAKEMNVKLVDDLQVLLKNQRVAGSNKKGYFQSHKLPSDYFDHSRVTAICTKGNCSGIRIPSDLVEDSNVDVLLGDYNSQPSFDFEQTFHVIAGNKIKQYHNDDFAIKEIDLSYFKTPQYITFPGTHQFDGEIGKDITWEFKEDVCDLIIEEAIMILSANIKDYPGVQNSQNNLQNNK